MNDNKSKLEPALRHEIEQLISENKRLAVEAATLRMRQTNRRAVLLEVTASRLLPALVTSGSKLSKAEAANNAIERAAMLTAALDDYFDRETQRGGS